MGNGYPIAAVITTRAVADSFKNTGVEYFNTVRHNVAVLECPDSNERSDRVPTL